MESKVKKLLMASALVALALGSPAAAYVDVQCELGIGAVACLPRSTNPDAKVIHIPQEAEDTSPAGIAARAAWTARCKPTLSPRHPNTGMRHWTWAEKGCEYGPD